MIAVPVGLEPHVQALVDAFNPTSRGRVRVRRPAMMSVARAADELAPVLRNETSYITKQVWEGRIPAGDLGLGVPGRKRRTHRIPTVWVDRVLQGGRAGMYRPITKAEVMRTLLDFPDVLTLAEVAEALSCNAEKVAVPLVNRAFPGSRTPSGHYKVRKEALAHWVAECANTGLDEWAARQGGN